MIVGKLSNTEFDYINTLLTNNKGISKSEYNTLKEKHPYAIVREDNIHIIVKKMTHYTKHDSELSDFILSKFGNDNLDIDFLYKITYSEGEYAEAHRDKASSFKTVLILLNDNFEGGNLIINGTDVLLNKKGMYIEFNGHLNTHEVTKVTKGVRNILAIFLEKKQTII